MDRRELFTWMGAAAASAASSVLAAADAPPVHDMSKMPGMAGMHDHAAMANPYHDLIASTSACVNAGEACLSHCLALLTQGDTSMAGCARTVRDVIAACTALRELAAANSSHVGAFARVVRDVCRDCATECHKHEQHAVCKACEDACEKCATECGKVAA